MKLLLHACCADCTLKYVASLKEQFESVDVYYYNPNIHPRSEYLARLKAMQLICEKEKINIIVADWSPREWFERQSFGTQQKERCPRCWDLRIGRTTEYAKKNGYEAFSTTLVTSQYQDQETVKLIAQKWEKETGVKFFVPEKVCCDLETKGFYKQFFCGCVYSMRERYEEKYEK